MAHLRVEHVFPCTEDRFWSEVFFAKDYNEGLFKRELRFPVWEETERKDTAAELTRVVKVVPRIGELPLALKKLVGEGIGYDEFGRFDKKTRRYRLDVKPSKLADKLTITGEMFTEPAGEGSCKRIFTATVTAKIFAIGGILEQRVIDDLKKSYEVAARFTRDYVTKKE